MMLIEKSIEFKKKQLSKAPSPYLYNEDHSFFSNYTTKLARDLKNLDWEIILRVASQLLEAWKKNRNIFICGNGGSAGNANHIANDLLYAVCEKTGLGLNVNSLCANPSIITCLANDVGYENIYSEQRAVHGNKGDILIVLSGSGNSPNVINAIQMAKSKKILSVAVVGFDGGRCKDLADICIHCKTNDMQIAEDIQLSIGHMMMQWLKQKIFAYKIEH